MRTPLGRHCRAPFASGTSVCVVAVVSSVLVMPAVAVAGGRSSTKESGDTAGSTAAKCKRPSISVNGITGEDGSFGTQFTDTPQNAATAVNVVPGPLTSSKGGQPVPAAAVTATGLAPNTGTQTFNLGIAGISDPGRWTGSLTLYAGGAPCSVELIVTASAQPTLTSAQGGAATLALSDKRNWPSLWPSSAIEHVSVAVRNNSQADAHTCRPEKGGADRSVPCKSSFSRPLVTVALYNGTDGHALAGVTPPKTLEIDAGDSKQIRLTLDGSKLSAGQYTGSVSVRLWNNPTPQVIPLTVNVKDGLFFPLVVIAAALLLRLLVEWLAPRTKAGKALTAARKTAQVKRRALKAPDTDRALLLERANKVKHELTVGTVDEAASEARALESAERALRRARRHESAQSAALGDDQPVADHADLRQELPSVWVQTAAAALRQDLPAGSAETVTKKAKALTYALPNRTRGDHTSYYFLRLGTCAVDVVTVIVLILLLLQAAYFTNATFGASLLPDYGGLFVAALTTAAAGKLVSGIVSGAISTGGGS
jgi:hypothetical protein